MLVAGAGPVGLMAAAWLAQRDVPVTVLEAGDCLATQSRASTFHPPTLDMLDAVGAARPLIAQGLVAPHLQYRTRDECLATFDFGELADLTAHPYRLQAEQFKLTRILADLLAGQPGFELAFDARLSDIAQDDAGVTVTTEDGRSWHGDWLIAADGASSAARKQLGVAFEGFTWDERFLVVSTPFDFRADIPDLASVSYVSDPARWHFFLQIPGVWRMMFPVAPGVTDEQAGSDAYVQDQMATLIPGRRGYEVRHTTLYRVHQRVADRYRVGRVFLAGDAAHVNNPLGGMGMNGGLHDAVNLAGRLAAGDDLDGYERQRRQVNIEYVQAQTIRNKENLEARDPLAHEAFKVRMREAARDPSKRRAFLLGASMIDSLERAKQLA